MLVGAEVALAVAEGVTVCDAAALGVTSIDVLAPGAVAPSETMGPRAVVLTTIVADAESGTELGAGVRIAKK